MTDQANPQPSPKPSKPVDAAEDRELDAASANASEPPLESSELESSDGSNELAEMHDRWIRTVAELDNLRKRNRREVEDVRRYASLQLMADLLAVIDNLDRAVEAAAGNEAVESLLEGVKMVAGQMHATLEKYGCQRIDAVGQPFDPNLHEAVFMEPTAEVPPNTVTKELLTGYTLYDRVIRPSQVAVATESPGASTNPPTGEAEGDPSVAGNS